MENPELMLSTALKQMISEGALFRDFCEHGSIIKDFLRMLKKENANYSCAMNVVNLKARLIPLEYGNRLPKAYIRTPQVLEYYLNHDLITDDYLLKNLADHQSWRYIKIGRSRSFYHLLRQNGQFDAKMCSLMLSWMVEDISLIKNENDLR